MSEMAFETAKEASISFMERLLTAHSVIKAIEAMTRTEVERDSDAIEHKPMS